MRDEFEETRVTLQSIALYGMTLLAIVLGTFAILIQFYLS